MQNKIQSIIKEAIINSLFQTDEINFTYNDADETLWCQVTSKEAHLLTGREGEALRSLNYLIKKIVERSLFKDSEGKETPNANLGVRPPSMRFIVDVNDFHKKKIENLKTLAHMLSERAKYFKSSIETDTMPAFDRKIIHEFLADKPNIKTESSGIEPNRRVVIRYIENIA